MQSSNKTLEKCCKEMLLSWQRDCCRVSSDWRHCILKSQAILNFSMQLAHIRLQYSSLTQLYKHNYLFKGKLYFFAAHVNSQLLQRNRTIYHTTLYYHCPWLSLVLNQFLLSGTPCSSLLLEKRYSCSNHLSLLKILKFINEASLLI